MVITSSIAGFNRAPTAGYAYGQSKAATTHLMKMLATNLVPYSIRVNAIAPGRESFFSSECSELKLTGNSVSLGDERPSSGGCHSRVSKGEDSG